MAENPPGKMPAEQGAATRSMPEDLPRSKLRAVLPWAAWVFPLVLLSLGIWQKAAFGPYWVGGRHDPEYAYALNSVGILRGYEITHSTHPGTTLKVLGALPVALTYWLKDSANTRLLDNAVFKHIEDYLTSIWLFLLVLTVVVLAGIIWRWKREGKSPVPILLLLAGMCLHDQVWASTARAAPEALLLPVCMAFVFLIVSSIDTPRVAQPKFVSLFYGVLFAFALATKTTVIFLGVIPMLLLDGWRDRMAFLYTTAASYVLFSIPIVGQYRTMFRFLGGITSAQENMDAATGLLMVPRLLEWSPFFCAVFLISVVALMVAWPLRRQPGITPAYRALGATLIAQLLTLALISRHPVDRYLIPVEILCGVNLYAISLMLGEVPALRRFAAPPWRRAWLGVLCVAAIAGTVPFVSRVATSRQSLATAAKLKRYMKEKHPQDAVLYHERGSSQANAFFFGIFRSEHGRYRRQVEAQFGNAYIYRYVTGALTNLDDQDRSAEVLDAARKGRLVVRIPSICEGDIEKLKANLPGINLVKEMELNGECVYASEP